MQNRMHNTMPECYKDDGLQRMPLAMAYVPWQNLKSVYENLEEAYCEGTIFPELNLPFTGRRCVR